MLCGGVSDTIQRRWPRSTAIGCCVLCNGVLGFGSGTLVAEDSVYLANMVSGLLVTANY